MPLRAYAMMPAPWRHDAMPSPRHTVTSTYQRIAITETYITYAFHDAYAALFFRRQGFAFQRYYMLLMLLTSVDISLR